jgi:hypothetical protein
MGVSTVVGMPGLACRKQRLRQVFMTGFVPMHRATETLFNLELEARNDRAKERQATQVCLS